LNGIGIKTQSFRRIVEPFIWNYLVESDMEGNDLIGVPDNNAEDKDSIGIFAGPQLTPPGATVISQMTVSKSRNEKQKLNKVTSIDSVPLIDNNYPLLSHALGQEDGFNPSDPTMQKDMQALLAELIDLLSADNELNVIDSRNKTLLSFVQVPKTSSDRSFQNSKEWLDIAIKIAGSKHGGTYKSAYRIANHLCRFYKDSFLAACETQKVVVSKPMSATAFLEHVEWQMANIEGGLGDKMEDWVERLHQTGKRQRLRYRTVQNPVIRSLAREKANSRNMHPDVIAQTDKINEGSKRNLVEQKADLVGMLRKRQRDVGRFEAMNYFKQDNIKRLTWSAPLFNDTKEGASNAGGIEHSCHLEKELSSTKL
jgi:hypothetical protein